MLAIVQWIRSLIFVVQMYLAMTVIGLFGAPISLLRTNYAYAVVRLFCNYVTWSASWIIGLQTEIRGEPPSGEILIAAKHQSFLDVIMILSKTPQPKFIMKSSLTYMPIIGFYARRIGCIPVKRGRRTEAIKTMIAAVQDGNATPGQLIIYPQGTRVTPGDQVSYKVGAAILYEELGQPCMPVACNVGLFWGRLGIYKKSGKATIEFLPVIMPGLDRNIFLSKLEETIERRSNDLMNEVIHNTYSK
tara:strand:+ start:472 stop:1209 length:738 start_codon:yes stop_codon:yes gene_type:complete